MKKLACLLFTIIITMNSYAQKEAFNWYFGGRAAINFDTDPPHALTNSVMNNFEGCASISDEDGNLLFYTNGTTVWNRDHVVMQNGTDLYGHESSTQSAVIVKKNKFR